MEEYLTTKQLSERIRYEEQTLYNLIHNRTLVLGKHYLKPSPKKLLFKWSEMKAWLGDAPDPDMEAKDAVLGSRGESQAIQSSSTDLEEKRSTKKPIVSRISI